MKERNPKISIAELVEKYRLPIGIGLLVLVVASVGYLFYRENWQKPSEQNRIENLESRIDQLENQKTTEAKTADATQPAAVATDNSGAVAAASTSTAAPAAQTSGIVNINTASLAQLDTLPGIGPVYAGRIIEYRTSHGGFKSLEEIMNVKGIGEKTFEKFKDRITL